MEQRQLDKLLSKTAFKSTYPEVVEANIFSLPTSDVKNVANRNTKEPVKIATLQLTESKHLPDKGNIILSVFENNAKMLIPAKEISL